MSHRETVGGESSAWSAGPVVLVIAELEERGLEARGRALADVERVCRRAGPSPWRRSAGRAWTALSGSRVPDDSRSKSTPVAELPKSRSTPTRRRFVEREVERRVAGLQGRRRLEPLTEVASANKRSSGQICLPMMTTLSQSESARLADFLAQALRGAQERVLVAPDEEDFEQLELQVAAIRRGFEGLLHELGGLVVKP